MLLSKFNSRIYIYSDENIDWSKNTRRADIGIAKNSNLERG